MKNTNIIYSSSEYQKLLSELENFEKDRIFCKHDFRHFLDVARIMSIYLLENNMELNRDLVYTLSILHDIGRVDQYRDQTPHAEASYTRAKKFLEMTDFNDQEKSLILKTIKKHNTKDANDLESEFVKLFYKADKSSRECYACPARSQCYWSDEKKNLRIII